jgi:dihydrolipoamide dehydrogenase
MSDQRLAILGGGPGGYAAAFLAADLGLSVTLIDEAPNPGGVCLYRGCIPSKALLHVAKVIGDAQEAEAWGVRFTKPRIDLNKVRDWKESVIGRMTAGLGSLAKQRKVTLLQGQGRFMSSREITVTTENGEQRVAFDHAIIATGSRPAVVPALAIDSDRVLDSTSALELTDVPKRLLVVGGGYIGLELGSAYGALGSAVTVVEMTDGLLPGVDRDLVDILERRLNGSLKAIHTGTRVDAVEDSDKGLSVTFSGAESGTKHYDRMLISVGRIPNTEDIGLEKTKVIVSDGGFIDHDDQQRTDDPAIFVVGDVAGQPMLAHKASHEGRVAAEVAAGKRVAFEPQAIPAVVFTDPEIAWCGLTETEAQETGRDVEVARFPWGASGRATTLGRSEGFTKLLIDRRSERVIGCGIVGPGAGELIAEAVLAIEMGAVATDVRLTVHPHPTLSETMMEASEVMFGTATHIFRPNQ